MRLEPVVSPSLARRLGLPALALLAAMLLAMILAALAGAPPLQVLGQIWQGAAGSRFALLETLNRATPLIFTGLSVAVAFRARLWNIGAEGQLYLGAVMTVLIGTHVALPAPLLLPAMAVAAALAGAAALMLPTLLKTRAGVDEVVTTLLLNFVILLLVSYLLEGPMKDPMGMGWPKSERLPAVARLPRMAGGLRLHWGFGLALIAAVAVWLMQARSVLGFRMQAVGLNIRAARFAGMPTGRVLMLTALISGGLAGLAGFSEVAGLKGALTKDLSAGFGTGGIIVAMLAALNPLGVVPAAIFVAGVFVGSDAMSRSAGVPSYVSGCILAAALLFMALALKLVRNRVVRG